MKMDGIERARRRMAREQRVRDRLCLFPDCDRAADWSTDTPWTMCKRPHSAGGAVNFWRATRWPR